MYKEGISHKKAQEAQNRLRLFWAFCAFLWLIPFSVRGEIIDKIVAEVDGRIITLSDARQERTIRERLGDKPIDDDKVLIQQMIEDRLIESQIADFPGIEAADEEVDAYLEKIRERNGPPSPELREAVRRRVQKAKYFDVRFRQFLRATDEDVKKYYDDVFVPEARTRGLNPIPPFEQVSDAVRQNVIEESLNHEVSVWLEAIRRRSKIEVFE